MDEATRKRLDEKKQWVQTQQRVKYVSKQLEGWWLPTLRLVQEQGIPWQMEYFNCVEGLAYTHWQNQLQQDPWKQVGPEKLPLREQRSYYVHEKVLEHYPNHHPLRYLPKLSFVPSSPIATDPEILTKAFQRLSPKGGKVYFFYMRMAPVLILESSDLVTLAGKGILDVIEDICITPADYSWLISRSLEEEWQFGYQQ